MANPLQPKVIKILEVEYDAFVVVATGTSKSGIMDVIACVRGKFYGFEVKWNNDRPSSVQKAKINRLIDSGGRGYFIRSEWQLRSILDDDILPHRYDLGPRVTL